MAVAADFHRNFLIPKQEQNMYICDARQRFFYFKKQMNHVIFLCEIYCTPFEEICQDAENKNVIS